MAKLLETELLRVNGEEQILFPEEHKDLISLTPSAPGTRPDTSNSDKTLPELATQPTEKTLVMKIEKIFIELFLSLKIEHQMNYQNISQQSTMKQLVNNIQN